MFPTKKISADLIVVGGGLAGICTAVAAARNGMKVILVQDRPVLGGNASSEIRMWICGANGGRGNRETGLLEELKLYNYFLNPSLNYPLWDGAMYSFVTREPNIKLLLNTTVTGVQMESAAKSRIASVTAWNLISYTEYEIAGRYFADCSGDSILRLSGADYRIGRESSSEFGESLAPAVPDKKTMGNSILIQLRRTKEDKPFRAPEWAYHFTDENFCRRDYVCKELKNENFWWMEFGGIRDTVGDADEIRQELIRIAYGVWAYLKNNHRSDAAGWELDWIGALPGKRESARYVGDVVMTQSDIDAGGKYPDVIGHGGWTMDDHHPEAMFTREEPNIDHPTPSPFGIPYRALYSRNIDNLFFAGRNISTTHMALSATRVMGTCSVLGQAVGTAAALALRYNLSPRGVYEQKLAELQNTLLDQDQLIPGFSRKVSELALRSKVSCEAVRAGLDRSAGEHENGALFSPGEPCEYTFPEPVDLCSCRIVFDSDLADEKKMRNIASAESEYVDMPAMLAKSYAVEVFSAGKWLEVSSDTENIRRLVCLNFPAVKAEKLRLTIRKAWGSGPARVFSFEPNV